MLKIKRIEGEKMRYAVISDVHSNAWSLRQAIQDALKEGVDKFIFLGDYITDGMKDNEVLELVKRYGDYVVKGNREDYIIDLMNDQNMDKETPNQKPLWYTKNSLTEQSLEYIKSLPDHILIKKQGHRMLIIHGNSHQYITERNIKMLDKLINDYQFDICLSGHTHVIENFMYRNHQFINPGSIGRPSDGPTYKYMILEIEESIKVTIKEISINDTWEELEKEYKKSAYYKDNQVYCDLFLTAIKDGKDYFGPFIEKYRSQIQKNQKEDPNKIWNQLYQEWQKNKKDY